MLARPEIQSCQYSFAGSITLAFASGAGAPGSADRESLSGKAGVSFRG